VRTFAVSPPLAPFVREFMVVEVGDEITRVQLPEPGMVLGVRYQGAAALVSAGSTRQLPHTALTGMRLTTRRMLTRANSGVLLARFRPGGAAAFLGQPLHELFGDTVALDELVPRGEVARLQARVAEADGDRARAAILESFLLERLGTRAPDPVVAAAVRAIEEAHGAIQIRALARSLGISQDPLEKRFRRSVGASPKQLASLLRLRRAIEGYRPGLPLTRLAQEAGYFDQSHFIRALRAATGEAPGRFLRDGLYR
jgi:methylphosphotriester-DNA--protein-cysteine methyltransferase